MVICTEAVVINNRKKEILVIRKGLYEKEGSGNRKGWSK